MLMLFNINLYILFNIKLVSLLKSCNLFKKVINQQRTIQPLKTLIPTVEKVDILWDRNSSVKLAHDLIVYGSLLSEPKFTNLVIQDDFSFSSARQKSS